MNPNHLGHEAMSALRLLPSKKYYQLLFKRQEWSFDCSCWLPLTRHESASLPGEERHDAVVDDVKRRHVLELLPRQEEEGVEELCELAEEVPPRGRGHPVA